MLKSLRIAALLLALIFARQSASAQARYIFFFIGDGMGMGHVNTAETYWRDVACSPDPLLMLTFPVASQVRTFSANSPITDSAAAATALSTGFKTNNYTVGMAPDSTNLYSITRDFLNMGYRIGVASTVAGDDATPAAFYGHALDRGMKYTLAPQAATSGFTFLAGPVWKGMTDENGDTSSWRSLMKKNGYTIFDGFSAYEDARYKKGEKILLLSDLPQGRQVGYTLDSIPGAMTIRQITQAGLKSLTQGELKPFFLMVEAGNIDWAAHANDGATMLKEIINFQEAIDIAYNFYLLHPDETLIVVTADHDTGGCALGRSDNPKNPQLQLADYQKISKDRFSDWCKSVIKENPDISWEEMKDFLAANLGFFGAVKITEAEEADIHKAFEDSFLSRTAKDEKTLYNDFNRFAVVVYDIMNRRLGIGWTSPSHTANFVPLYAIGAGSSLFTGNLNNTEVPRLILKAASSK